MPALGVEQRPEHAGVDRRAVGVQRAHRVDERRALDVLLGGGDHVVAAEQRLGLPDRRRQRAGGRVDAGPDEVLLALLEVLRVDAVADVDEPVVREPLDDAGPGLVEAEAGRLVLGRVGEPGRRALVERACPTNTTSGRSGTVQPTGTGTSHVRPAAAAAAPAGASAPPAGVDAGGAATVVDGSGASWAATDAGGHERTPPATARPARRRPRRRGAAQGRGGQRHRFRVRDRSPAAIGHSAARRLSDPGTSGRASRGTPTRPRRCPWSTKLTVCAAPSSSSACSSVIPMALLSSRLDWARAIGGPAARRVAQLVDELVELAVGHDPVDEPDAVGLGGVDDVGEQRELLGPVHPDAPRQRPRAAEVDRQAAPGEDLREAGRVAGDDEVAQQGHVHAGAGGDAADLGDRRLRDAVAAPWRPR